MEMFSEPLSLDSKSIKLSPLRELSSFISNFALNKIKKEIDLMYGLQFIPDQVHLPSIYLNFHSLNICS